MNVDNAIELVQDVSERATELYHLLLAQGDSVPPVVIKRLARLMQQCRQSLADAESEMVERGPWLSVG